MIVGEGGGGGGPTDVYFRLDLAGEGDSVPVCPLPNPPLIKPTIHETVYTRDVGLVNLHISLLLRPARPKFSVFHGVGPASEMKEGCIKMREGETGRGIEEIAKEG